MATDWDTGGLIFTAILALVGLVGLAVWCWNFWFGGRTIPSGSDNRR